MYKRDPSAIAGSFPWVAGKNGGKVFPEDAGIRFGHSVALSYIGLWMIVGAPMAADGWGAIYLYQSDPGAAEFYPWSTILGSQISQAIGPAASLGTSVSISGGGEVFAVGMENHDSGRGAAAIFYYSDMDWQYDDGFVQGEAQGDKFGHAVSLDFDGNTLVVSAPLADGGAGAVYVYRQSAGNWNFTPRKISITNTNQFGFALALSADALTLVVGEPGTDKGRWWSVTLRHSAAAHTDGAAGAWLLRSIAYCCFCPLCIFAARDFTWSGSDWLNGGFHTAADAVAAAPALGSSIAVSADGNTVMGQAHRNTADKGTPAARRLVRLPHSIVLFFFCVSPCASPFVSRCSFGGRLGICCGRCDVCVEQDERHRLAATWPEATILSERRMGGT